MLNNPESYISCHQFICIVNGGHLGLPLRDEGVVIGVVCDKQHLCRTQTQFVTMWTYSYKPEDANSTRQQTNPRSLAFCWTESGRICDNLAQPLAGRSPEISPEDLRSEKSVLEI